MKDAATALEKYQEGALATLAESPWRTVSVEQSWRDEAPVHYRYELPADLEVDLGRTRVELAARDWVFREEDGAMVFERTDFVPAAGILAEPAHIDALEVTNAGRAADGFTGVLYHLLIGVPVLIFAAFLVDEFSFIVKWALVCFLLAVLAPTVVVLQRRGQLPHQLVRHVLRKVDVDRRAAAVLTFRHDKQWTAELTLTSERSKHSRDAERLYRAELARMVASPSSPEA